MKSDARVALWTHIMNPMTTALIEGTTYSPWKNTQRDVESAVRRNVDRTMDWSDIRDGAP